MSKERQRTICVISAASGLLAMTPLVLASWPEDPAMNQAIADRIGDQIQPKICIAPDGSAFVSWFDNADGGYDVYLQRFDPDGNELWTHNGILLADRNYSSTQDYDLDVDALGYALVTFTDDRAGFDQITATRVSPDGLQIWGDTGVQVTTAPVFLANPKIAATSDGQFVVAWTGNNSIKLQRLDADGNRLWIPSIEIPEMEGDSVSAADLDASDDGSVIISLVRGFMGPNYLYAQKFASDRTPLWGESPLAIYDGGALQIANYPQFVTDGSGGAVFAWYSVSAGLQCHAQRILADGTEQFGHNGVLVSTETADRTMPEVSFRPETQETFVFWREEPPGEYGLYAQKFDVMGIRQWTDSGVAIWPASLNELLEINQIQFADGAMAFWVETFAFGNQHVHAARVDTDGVVMWDPADTDVSMVESSKSRLTAASLGDRGAILAWSDNRSGDEDIYGQNINSDGTLGAKIECPGDVNGDKAIDPLDSGFVLARLGCAVSTGDPACDAADTNIDGIVDPLDVGFVMSRFGVCP